MAITNHERVGEAMELLRSGLGSFVEREMAAAYPGTNPVTAASQYRDSPKRAKGPIPT